MDHTYAASADEAVEFGKDAVNVRSPGCALVVMILGDSGSLGAIKFKEDRAAVSKVNTVLNVHRNRKAYQGRGERGVRGYGGGGKREIIYLVWRWGEEGDYIPGMEVGGRGRLYTWYGGGGKRGIIYLVWRWGEEGDYIPIAILSPPE